tara:strand:- start:153 stop:1019 length:867 start_codon:yes stop_codon:yes gene_type:complete
MLNLRLIIGNLLAYLNSSVAAKRVLDAQEILNQKKIANKSSLIWTTHKCASVYIKKVIHTINKHSEVKGFDYSSTIWSLGSHIKIDNPYEIESISSLYRTHGEIYGPLRTPFEFEGMSDFNNVFFLRDPRDLLVSRYYSMSFLHRSPYHILKLDVFKEKRNQAKLLGINHFCLKYAEEWIIPYFDKFRKIKDSSKESSLLKYDVFVENPSAFINQFLNSLHVSLPIKVENKLIKLAKLPHNKKSKNFNFKSHFRSGKNRQFEHELDESTVKELNIILKDILYYWNFEI